MQNLEIVYGLLYSGPLRNVLCKFMYLLFITMETATTKHKTDGWNVCGFSSLLCKFSIIACLSVTVFWCKISWWIQHKYYQKHNNILVILKFKFYKNILLWIMNNGMSVSNTLAGLHHNILEPQTNQNRPIFLSCGTEKWNSIYLHSIDPL